MIIISLYSLHVDYDEIKRLADKYGVILETRGRRDKGWGNHIFDLEGKQDIASNFVYCYLNCPQLKNGKRSPCGIITSVQHFNNAFGERMEIKEDSLDILSDINAQDVLDFLLKPAHFAAIVISRKITVKNGNYLKE